MLADGRVCFFEYDPCGNEQHTVIGVRHAVGLEQHIAAHGIAVPAETAILGHFADQQAFFGFAGHFEQDVAATLGDFPLARDEHGAGYTLAVVVDDAEMGVTEVVRGDDLLPATPAQILLQRALGYPTPAYCHVPLVVGPDGRRLAKRHGDTRIAAFREAGRSPEWVLSLLAASCGWCAPGESVTLRSLLPRFSLATVPKTPFML